MSNAAEVSGEAGHFIVGLNALLFVGIVSLCMFMNLVVNKFGFNWLPESGMAMILGFIIGGIMTLVDAYKEEAVVMFEPEIFFFFLLPPIILEAGFSMKKRNFFANMTSILMFAVLGTLISTMVVGYGLFGLAEAGMLGIGGSDGVLEFLMFGALISAVDPVATLAILGSKRVNADELLYSLVFGESVLNDAVAIVLFNTFRGIMSSPGGTQSSIFWVFGKFVSVSFASLGIGVLVALLSAIMFKELNFQAHKEYEFVLVCFFAYSAYCVSEILSLSGIMALFFCGILMAHYTWYNMDPVSRETTALSLKGMAMVSETFLFVYLGITAVVYLKPEFHLHWNGWLIVFTVLLCIVGRAIQIFLISQLVNLGRKTKIPFKMQLVMIFAGLRGAIAFALSLNVTTQNNKALVTTTITIVILTTLGCGTATFPLLKKLGLVGNQARPSLEGNHEEPMLAEGERSTRSLSEDAASAPTDTGFHAKWNNFDKKYMQVWFGGKYNPKIHQRPGRRPRSSPPPTHHVQMEPLQHHEDEMELELCERKSVDEVEMY